MWHSASCINEAVLPPFVLISAQDAGSAYYWIESKPKMIKSSGFCQLTKRQGPFVKCHLIPKALTKPSISGNHFLQSTHGEKVSRRWSSWYDDKLVIRKGEDVLEKLDNWGIRELRNGQLIWSGFDKTGVLPDQVSPPHPTHGFRNIVGLDPSRLRLFFLSLLWRAAASKQKEFEQIDLPPNDLERLRLMILNNNPAPISFYPAVLVQLSTKGPAHNRSPFLDEALIPAQSDTPPIKQQSYRFYFDGLIAHMYLKNNCYIDALAASGGVVGASDNLLVQTIAFEASAQGVELNFIRLRTELHYPDSLPAIGSPPPLNVIKS